MAQAVESGALIAVAPTVARHRIGRRGVAANLEEAGERLFTFLRYPSAQWKPLRTTIAIERLHVR